MGTALHFRNDDKTGRGLQGGAKDDRDRQSCQADAAGSQTLLTEAE